jgi:hypothetical protein
LSPQEKKVFLVKIKAVKSGEYWAIFAGVSDPIDRSFAEEKVIFISFDDKISKIVEEPVLSAEDMNKNRAYLNRTSGQYMFTEDFVFNTTFVLNKNNSFQKSSIYLYSIILGLLCALIILLIWFKRKTRK